jgi:hypothetical protein
MRHLLLGALAVGLAPVTAMAGGHSSYSSFGLSIGIGSSHRGNSWSFRYSSGPSWGYSRSHVAYCPPPVIYQPAPVYVAPAPVYVSPAPIYTTPAPVYVSPAPVYVSPAPVYVNPAPIVIQRSPVIISSPPVLYQSSVHIDLHSGFRSNGNFRYHGGTRYSYHR